MSGIEKAQPQAVQQAPATLQQYLGIRTKHLADVAAKGLSPDRLIKLAILASNRNPKLAECDMGSVFLALMQCAELGLEPSGTLGGAYLVPYGKQCQMIVGYRGLIDLARRSGVLEQIEAHVVYSRDTFECEFGLTPKLRHVPEWSGDRGERVLVYMVARLKGGGVHVDVMGINEVDAIRKRSRSSNNGPWVTDYDEMAKKTVVRRGLKMVPMSSELQEALERDAEVESGGTQADAGAAVLGSTRTEQVKQRLMVAETPAEVVQEAQQVESVPTWTPEQALTSEVLLSEIPSAATEQELDAIGKRAESLPKGSFARNEVGKAINTRRGEIRGAR